MFIRNDVESGRYFNGKIGKIASINRKEIIVTTDEGNQIEVEKITWENKRYKLGPDNESFRGITEILSSILYGLLWRTPFQKARDWTLNKWFWIWRISLPRDRFK